MKKYLDTLLLVLIGVITIGVVVIAAFLFWPIKVADYNTPYEVRPKVIEAGQTVYYTSNYCKYLPLQAEVNRSIVDGTVIFLPSVTTNLETGCHKIDIPVTIPLNTPPGNYHIHISIRYKVNFIREITAKIETKEFTVKNDCLVPGLKKCP